MSADKLMYIGGQWVESSSGQRFESENPATGEVLGTVPRGNAADIAGKAADAYHQLALKANVGAGHSWPHVVLAAGRLFVKDDNGKLLCFVVSKPR